MRPRAFPQAKSLVALSCLANSFVSSEYFGSNGTYRAAQKWTIHLVSPNFQNVNRLMNYLMENCCGGDGCTIDLSKLSGKIAKQQEAP